MKLVTKGPGGKVQWLILPMQKNQKRDLIAEGEFTVDSLLVKGQGGCDYYIKSSKIIKEKWRFYNSEQKIIEPHFEDIFILENANQ